MAKKSVVRRRSGCGISAALDFPSAMSTTGRGPKQLDAEPRESDLPLLLAEN